MFKVFDTEKLKIKASNYLQQSQFKCLEYQRHRSGAGAGMELVEGGRGVQKGGEEVGSKEGGRRGRRVEWREGKMQAVGYLVGFYKNIQLLASIHL